MPKAQTRQRTVFCDCFDCLDRPAPSIDTAEGLIASNAAARQEPPPKALVIFASGLLRCIKGEATLDAAEFPHLGFAARDGAIGLLAVRESVEDSVFGGAAISELAQLLGVHQELLPLPAWSADALAAASLPSLQTRFKGMAAAFASTSPAARQLAEAVGLALSPALQLPCDKKTRPAAASASDAVSGEAFSAAPAPAATSGATTADRDFPAEAGDAVGLREARGGEDTGAGADPPRQLPDAGQYTTRVLAELGADQGASGTDLLLLHLDLEDLVPTRQGSPAPADAAAAAVAGSSSAESEEVAFAASLAVLAWLDEVFKHLLAVPAVRDSVYLVLVLSPSGVPLTCPAASAAAAATVPGPANHQSGATTGTGPLLLPGGTLLDPDAAVATPRSAAAVGRGGAAAAAAAAASTSGGTTGLQFLTSLCAEEGSGHAESGAAPRVVRPVQSFERLAGHSVAVAARSPLLVVRRLPGVVRRDRSESVSLVEALQRGGQGAMMVDRLLPEVAYKLGRAPKYGA